MPSHQSSYRKIIKATSIFGGVQVFQILISLIKAKLVAMFIGAAGMGIAGLLTSTMSVVTALSTLGLNYGAVREFAQASLEKDINKINKTYRIFSRWLYVSSIVGVITVMLLSSFFSNYAFGNRDYTWAFFWLSITVFFDVFTQRNNTLLQGTGKINDLAKSSILGSGFGLIVSIPLYYFFGIKGIVPGIIIAAVMSFFISFFFSKKIKLEKYDLSIKQIFIDGRDIFNLGIVMMFSLFMGRVVIISVNAFINYTGSISDVGLYSAGTAITSQSIGLIFTAMSLDYFPRLSSISSDNVKVREMVNQQSEVIMLIIFPILVALIIFAPLIIRVLLTPEFNSLKSFIQIIAIGTIFQAASYTVGMTLLAKGDKKNYFFFNAILANLLGLLFFIIGYYLYGINGLAIAIGIHHFVFFIVYLAITKRLYNYSMSKGLFINITVCFCVVLCVYLLVSIYPNLYGYSFATLLLLISILYSLFNLNKLIGIRQYYNDLISKLRNK